MDLILGFFSDLILFTAGLVVLVLWIVLLIEVVDTIKESIMSLFDLDEEEEDY